MFGGIFRVEFHLAKADKSRQKQPENKSNFEFSKIKLVQLPIKADKSKQKQAKATDLVFSIFENFGIFKKWK